VKLIWQARCKTDPIDARKLADLARTNLLPAIWVATPAVRAIPSTQSSGGKTTLGGVGRAGSPWLKWILIEIVQSLKLAPGPIGHHYLRTMLLDRGVRRGA
jgi:hypothetical protein